MNEPIHVIPEFKGEKAHKESVFCWCGPVLINETEVIEYGDAPVYSHNRPQ